MGGALPLPVQIPGNAPAEWRALVRATLHGALGRLGSDEVGGSDGGGRCWHVV